MPSKQMIFIGVIGTLAAIGTANKIQNPDNGIPWWPLILMWIGSVGCLVCMCAQETLAQMEADEKEENSPETVAAKLQVDLLRAQHQLEMARIKQAMPPEPPKQEVRDDA